MCVAGGDRGKGVLIFLFSTAKDQSFSTMEFVIGIRKALPNSVEIIQSVKIELCVEV